MRKLLQTLLIGSAILTTTIQPIFAENFTYKVYNPRTNKAYTAVLGTIGMTDTQYLWAFYKPDGEALCVASVYNTNKNDKGLVGGQCSDTAAFIKFVNHQGINLEKYQLGWRELSTDTLYREMESIRRERAAQGKTEYGTNNSTSNSNRNNSRSYSNNVRPGLSDLVGPR